jgi:hypothetical protein
LSVTCQDYFAEFLFFEIYLIRDFKFWNLADTVNVLYNELYKIGSLYRMWAIFPEVSKCLTVHCCSQLRHHFSSHFGANFIFLSFANFKLKIKIR